MGNENIKWFYDFQHFVFYCDSTRFIINLIIAHFAPSQEGERKRERARANKMCPQQTN